jgi:secretion/DNA translocation related TadE-like protein
VSSTCQGEAGHGTVVALGMVGVLVALMLGGLALGSAVIGSHRARAAADLGALAAAVAVQRGRSPAEACETARGVVGANGARPGRCQVTADGVAEVSVTVPVPWSVPASPHGTARAGARAGPG